MWDLIQHFQINKALDDVNATKGQILDQQEHQGQLLDQVERLTLACQSMWELLRDHSGLTEGQLKAKMQEVDARDGRMDGKIGVGLVDCPACGQKTDTRRGKCVYCGGAIKIAHLFKS